MICREQMYKKLERVGIDSRQVYSLFESEEKVINALKKGIPVVFLEQALILNQYTTKESLYYIENLSLFTLPLSKRISVLNKKIEIVLKIYPDLPASALEKLANYLENEEYNKAQSFFNEISLVKTIQID